MSIIQTAKELLKKGIALNDPELIEMANTLLGTVSESLPTAAVEPQAKPKKSRAKAVVKEKQSLVDQFAIENKRSQSKRVLVKAKRINTFKDDGTLAKDEENITPKITPAKRDRPKFEKVKQVCQSCNGSVMVHPAHVREFYVCDGCLSNKTRGR
jgi:formamidopyrimidine-DNA glycosylase